MMRQLMTLLLLAGLAVTASGRAAAQTENPIPMLAYYYIWFDHSSWDRAKTDYPLLGRYSSDDRSVMAQHVAWAQAAGIDGFIVSWKSTDVLNPRLELLMDVAAEADFKLVIIYQGLDFERDPLPTARVDADLGHFKDVYAQDPVFDLFGRPVVIWSGTWKFSVEEIASVTTAHRDELLLLASERNLDGLRRVAGLVDGNAYYWSSVNPDTFPDYPGKLGAMGAEVHEQGGLWIAPAAPGFDARLIGGTTVVKRKDGDTLRIQLATALGSAPDAVGLISWNEFSENTHVEPSENFGDTYLELLSTFNEVFSEQLILFDSDPGPVDEAVEPAPVQRNVGLTSVITFILGGVLVGVIMIAAQMLRRGR